MSAQQKPKAKESRNDARPNGKAWKQGKHPDVREAERQLKLANRTPEQKARAEQRRMLREEKRQMLAPVDSDD